MDRVRGEYGGLRLKEVARDQVGEAGGPAVGFGTESGQRPETWGNKQNLGARQWLDPRWGVGGLQKEAWAGQKLIHIYPGFICQVLCLEVE